MGTHRLGSLLVLSGFLLLPAATWAQSASSGAIAGIVRDATGAVLPGVTVEAASPVLIEKVRTASTDSQGQYRITELRPGIYTVTFNLTGFSSVKRDGMELTTNFTAAVNVEMKLGSVEETITVTGASPVVDVQRTSPTKVLSRDILDTLPSASKSTQAFAALVPGVSIPLRLQDVGGTGAEDGAARMKLHNVADQRKTYDGMQFDGMNFGNTWHNPAAAEEMVLTLGSNTAEFESGGIHVNLVPKEGGNVFRGTGAGSFANDKLASSNISPELLARGLPVAQLASLKQVWDYNFGLGGPIRVNRLWFHFSSRWWGAQQIQPGAYYNATQGTPFYTADLSRPAGVNNGFRDHNLRVTWQASPRNKINVNLAWERHCTCNIDVGGAGGTGVSIAPEAARRPFSSTNMTQVTWSRPVSNRFLLEAGVMLLPMQQDVRRPPELGLHDIAITDTGLGIIYGASATGTYANGSRRDQYNGRFAASYVTGAHSFKTGLFVQRGRSYTDLEKGVNDAVSYTFVNRVPTSLTQWATPLRDEIVLFPNVGLYAQDQWTLRKLTLNLGIRFDRLNAHAPVTQVAAGPFVPARDFPEVENIPNWKDIDPRLGAAYDLFGNGKTALKVTVGRYLVAFGQGGGIALANAPSRTIVTSTTRTWNDAFYPVGDPRRQNYAPDCDLTNRTANGECGALANNRFGDSVTNTVYAKDVLDGWGVRDNNWQLSASIDQGLGPRVGISVGYFRTSAGNFTVRDNLAVTPTDHDPYCITAPVDARLPGGGGNQLCGLYDLNPSKLGQVNTLVTQASNYGKRKSIYNGVDVTINARFGNGGLLQGGVSTSETVEDTCFTVDQPARPGFCRETLPWSAATQLKLSGAYTFPWDVQASATYQNLAGPPILANYSASNAEIVPTLGRNLGQCGLNATCTGRVTVALIEPNTMFEDRLNQVDLRLSKLVRLGRTRVKGMVDIYNLFNAGTILATNTTYGAAWLRPLTILGPRFVKFGFQIDF